MRRLATVMSWLVCSCAAGAGVDSVDIPYQQFYLDNGLRVIVHEDHKAPIAAVTVWYHVGSKNEQAGKTGFAHLFEHLMFNGSENYDDEYFKPFQQVGATSMNGTTDFDRTNYFETVPSTAVDLALWMESDRMGHLLGAIDQDKLDEQRGVVQNEKRQSENQPYGKVFENIMQNVFPEGHPYSWLPIGSMADLNAASLDDVRHWFQSYYGPNNATLVIAGDVDAATMKSKAQLYFGDIQPAPPISRQQRWIPTLAKPRRVVLEDRAPQARVYKAWPAPAWASDAATRLELVDSILTEGKNSRLYRRLVYEDQIASDIGSFPFFGEIGGAFAVWVTAQPGQDLSEVERRLDEEVTKFLESGPTREELARVKTQYLAGFVRGIEQVGGFRGKSNILAENAVFGGRPDFYKHRLETIRASTAKQIADAARNWLSGPALTLEVHPYRQNLRASGEGAERDSPPMPQSFPDAPFPAMREASLSNGMRLIVAERHAVPIVRFSLQMNAGYASDEFASPGVANLAMQMLDEGTKSRDSLEISEQLGELGAELNSGSNLDFSFVNLSALKDNLDESLKIYADVILNPVFPEKEIQRLRRLQLSSIEQEKSRPMSMALRVFPKLVYGEGHAYSLPMTGSGTTASVESIGRDDLERFHRTWFKPNNATMIVVGDTTLDEVQPKLEALFSDWQRGDVPEKDIPNVELPSQQRVFLIDRPGSEQSMIFAGQVMPPKRDPQEIAIEAMNDVLGGSFTSRINMNLREDKTWSYGTRSVIVDTMGQRPFIAYAPVQGDKTAPSMAEIAREIREFVTSRPASSDEVETTKKRNTLSLPGRWETAGAVARDIAEIVRFHLPEDYWSHYAELVDELDATKVDAAAERVLAPNRLTWVVVGDLSKIEREVVDLQLGPVTVLDTEGNVLRSE
jgi:zinc protease